MRVGIRIGPPGAVRDDVLRLFLRLHHIARLAIREHAQLEPAIF